MRTLAFSLLLLVGISPAWGAAQYTVHVDPVGVARDYAGVVIQIPVDNAIASEYAKKIAGTVHSIVTTSDGKTVPSQLSDNSADGVPKTVTVRWVARDLSADKKATYTVSIHRGPTKPASTPFAFKDAEGGRICVLGDRPIWQHWTPEYDAADHANTYKHFHHVFGFHGEGHITKGAGGRYTHHRGLYIGWSKTTGPNGKYDFWHCGNNVSIRHAGYQADHEFVGPVASRSVSVANWVDKEGEPVVKETRTVTTWDVGEGRTLMDFHFKLASAGGDVELNGDPQHAGFQFRPRDSVNQTKATYIRPESASGGKGDVWQNTPWCVNQFKIEDKPYAVMHMDHPKNPGTVDGRTVYSTRNYGRFGAYAPHQLKADTPLKFNYRILVVNPQQHKDTSVAHFDALYQSYVKPVKATIVK